MAYLLMKPRREASLNPTSGFPLPHAYPLSKPNMCFNPGKRCKLLFLKEKKTQEAHEHEANLAVPLSRLPFNRLIQAPSPLCPQPPGTPAGCADSSFPRVAPLRTRVLSAKLGARPGAQPRRVFPRPHPTSPPANCASRRSTVPPPASPARRLCSPPLPVSACALRANRVAAADWWPRLSQSEGGTSR